MKNGLVDINSFKLLDVVRVKLHIKDKDWAEHSGLKHAVRISEMRVMANGTRDVQDRAFHVKKYMALVRGLKSIAGEEAVNKELTRLLDKAETPDEKLLLIMAILSEEKKQKVVEYAQMVAEIGEKKRQ